MHERIDLHGVVPTRLLVLGAGAIHSSYGIGIACYEIVWTNSNQLSWELCE